jgi:hypothetical protein
MWHCVARWVVPRVSRDYSPTGTASLPARPESSVTLTPPWKPQIMHRELPSVNYRTSTFIITIYISFGVLLSFRCDALEDLKLLKQPDWAWLLWYYHVTCPGGRQFNATLHSSHWPEIPRTWLKTCRKYTTSASEGHICHPNWLS